MLMIPTSILQIDEPDDRAFLTNLYLDFYGLMKHTAVNICKDDYRAEDIIQDSILKLIKKVDTLRGLIPPVLVSYIRQTVKHTALTYISKEERRAYYNNTVEKLLISTNTPETEFVIKEQFETLQKAIKKLSQRDQDLLYFRYFLDLSNQEIGAATGIVTKQVSYCIYLARCRAFKRMEGLDNEMEAKQKWT